MIEDLTEWNISELDSYFQIDNRLNGIWRACVADQDWDSIVMVCNEYFVYTPEQLQCIKETFTKEIEMDSQMKTYQVTSKAGKTKVISARTESDAFQQAVEFAGDDLIESWEEL